MSAPVPTRSDPANLLLITFDQWSGDWGDPYSPVVSLPGLQRLAKRGWTARRCYTSSPHCVPARMSWITGLEPSQLGVTRNADVSLPADAPSLIRPLQEQGWHTALVGKTHWTSHFQNNDLRENLPLMQALGFEHVIEVAGPRALRRVECELTDAWHEAGVLEKQRKDLRRRYGQGRSSAAWEVRPSVLPQELYPDIWIAERALKELASMPTNQPWLLWVSFVGPHEPFDTPAPWRGRHAKQLLPTAYQTPTWITELPNECEMKRAAAGWHGKLLDKEIKACRADYADHLQLLDDQLQRLLDGLNQRQDQSRTAVLLTSDHGDMLGDAGMLYKGTFLEGAVRVPCIYSCPSGVKPNLHGGVSTRPVQLTGLLAQVLKNLPTGGSDAHLHKWKQQQLGAVVEFGRERLLVQGPRKLVTDNKGVPIWATQIGRDPQEQHNLVKSTNWPRARWQRLLKWSREETTRRNQTNWLWRSLPLTDTQL